MKFYLVSNVDRLECMMNFTASNKSTCVKLVTDVEYITFITTEYAIRNWDIVEL